jgi:uncharacterized phiE125 gp8 family phage protein
MRLMMRAIGDAATEPVTIGQLRDHVRADDATDDAALIGFGISARTWIEMFIGRPIVPQTVRGICDAWPTSGSLTLSMPVNSVDSVTYTDADQATATWATGAAGWIARVSQGGTTSIRRASAASWPALGDDPLITVNATAGFASVPEPIVTAIAKLAAYLHADRDGIGDAGMGFRKMPPWRWAVLA